MNYSDHNNTYTKDGELMEKSLSLQVYRTLKYTSHQIKKDLRHKLKETGFTWTQFHALYHINKEGIPVNELAKELHCNASNITGLIDRMKKKELVYREHSEKDRRIWLVKLSENGSELKKNLFPEHLKNIEKRMSYLNKEELVTLKTLLDELLDTQTAKKKGGENTERT
jgi:MarR family 2-MHQ and catechol resistance regulon transcriptional repressor